MLHTITPDGLLFWQCVGREDPDDDPCGAQLSTRIEDMCVRYQPVPTTEEMVVDQTGASIHNPKGAVIVLPPCTSCGAITHLKADYTLKSLTRRRELYQERGGICVLKHQHACNLLVHHLLYTYGRAPTSPVVPMIPDEVLQHAIIGTMERGRLASLWWTYHLLTGSVDVDLFGHYFLGMMERANRLGAGEQKIRIEGQ